MNLEANAAEREQAILQRVLGEARAVAAETGGPRAAAAVSATASLEREVGLGSLERVELLSRLERAFERRLDESFLRLDTAGDLARALATEAPEAMAGAPRKQRSTALEPAAARIERARTVHEGLWLRADVEPDRPAVFLREDGAAERTISYGLLRQEAARVAGGLRESGIAKGDTVALMLPTSFDFLRTFQGILLAGAIPVPIYPPVRLDKLEEYALRQAAILADAEVKLLVTVTRARPVTDLLRPRVPSLKDVTTATDLAALGATWSSPDGSAEDPAFVQYTSGSTGNPKGVLLTHANLLANIEAIGAGLEARPTDVGVSWLPLYHDMGLIGSWLFCMHRGLPIAILSPLAFLSHPELWLWTMHERRGTMSAAPNFAYELCVKKIPDAALEGLDLSSWRCALNGAEPVNPETLERFVARFSKHGFRREALQPVYGLAESSVGLAFSPAGRGPKVDRVRREPFAASGLAEAAPDSDLKALRFVSVGRELPKHEIRVLDDSGAQVPERVVGRLAFRGPSMTSGYYRKPEATAAMTTADGFLDSGDLAYRADGEIYIAGRLKDLIIKSGRNLVPQEIEELASQVVGIRKGCVAAVGLTLESTGTEALVVVAETRATDEKEKARLATAVIEKVAEALGVPPDRVELVPPGSIPKTSSGKIRRAETKALLETGELGRPSRLSAGTRARLVWGVARERLRSTASSVGQGLHAAWVGLCLLVLFLLAWPLAMLLPRGGVRFFERLGCQIGLWLCGIRVEIRGLEKLPRGGPVVVASNHASYVDAAVLIAALPGPLIFVVKSEALAYPVVGTFLKRSGHLPVERFDAEKGAEQADRLKLALDLGERVAVFPEGTFTFAAGLRPFRLGAFKAAAEARVPITPVALQGTRRVLRDGMRAPRRGTVRVVVGDPILPQGEGWHAVLALRDRTAEVIAGECGEPRLDLVGAIPERPA